VFKINLARTKPILVFDLLALSIWVLCVNSFASSVWWWDIYNSIRVWIYACTYFLMTICGIGIVSYVLARLGRSVLIRLFLGLLIASMPLLSTGLIIYLFIYHPPGKLSWFDALLSWLGEFLLNPIFLFPNVLTICMLVYAAWKSSSSVASVSALNSQ
jgi:hypothetical protein